MNYWPLRIIGVLCAILCQQTSAFEVDGIRSNLNFQEVVNVLAKQGLTQVAHHTSMGTAYLDAGISYYRFSGTASSKDISAAFCNGRLSSYQTTIAGSVHDFAKCVEGAAQKSKTEPRMLSERYAVIPPEKDATEIIALFSLRNGDEMACIYRVNDGSAGTSSIRCSEFSPAGEAVRFR